MLSTGMEYPRLELPAIQLHKFRERQHAGVYLEHHILSLAQDQAYNVIAWLALHLQTCVADFVVVCFTILQSRVLNSNNFQKFCQQIQDLL